jgi:urocanate hydratase
MEFLGGAQEVLPPVPSGQAISTKDWEQEAVLRMLLHHQDLSVTRYFGKLPPYEYESLINWPTLRENVRHLLSLENDQTLLLEEGKPATVVKTSKNAPRVVQVNFKQEEFTDFKESAYYIYNEMLSSSWTALGIQDLIDINYRIIDRISQDHFPNGLEEKIAVTTGFGNSGAALALALALHKAVVVVIEINRKLVEKMVEDSFCSRLYEDFDSAFDVAFDTKKNGQSRVIGLVANASEAIPELVNKGIVPAIVTDRTNPRDLLNGYFPGEYSYKDALRIRRADSHHYLNLTRHSIMFHVKSMVELHKRGSLVFDFGNNIRDVAYNRGFDNAYGFPSFVPGYVYPELISEKLNLKWVALSGNSEDIFVIDDLIVDEFADNPDLNRLIDVVNMVILPNTIPARKCRLGFAAGLLLAKRINDLVRNEELSAPVLLGLSDFRAGLPEKKQSAAEILNQAIANPQGAAWVSVDYRGNDKEYYTLSEMMVVADGSKEAEQRIEQALAKYSEE